MSNQPEIAVEDLVVLFKALADPTRLRLAALIVDRARCGQDLAGELGISTGTVSHHLRVLREAGLVRETREPPYSFFQLDLGALQQALRAVSNKKSVREIAAEEDPRSSEERKVLRAFFDGPRLLALPVQRKKKLLVLEEVLRRLPRRKEYGERELSRYIEATFEDYCSVRREWIMGGYMTREAGTYRLTDLGRSVVAR